MRPILAPTLLLAAGMLVAPSAVMAHDHHGYHRHDDDRHHRRHHARRHHCRDKGTGGLIIGGIAGGLLGHEVAKDKTAGTIIGGGVGALAGRAIDRKNGRC